MYGIGAKEYDVSSHGTDAFSGTAQGILHMCTTVATGTAELFVAPVSTRISCRMLQEGG